MLLRSLPSLASVSLLLGFLPDRTLADEVLSTTGFSVCLADAFVTVDKVAIAYNKNTQEVTFDVSGSSSKSINVTASLNVTAYGISVYERTFNPCDSGTFVEQLCPVPIGNFAAAGTQTVPAEYANQVPSIAFSVPDIDATATLQLFTLDTKEEVACVACEVGNGKSVDVAAASYVAASVAGAAAVLTGLSAVGASAAGAGASSTGGLGTTTPSFTTVIHVFQGFAMNGMMSVNYPSVYRSFAKNFAFSAGIIPFKAMQQSIDDFRSVTGGNLTGDSVEYLDNATLTYSDGSTTSKSKRAMRRALVEAFLIGRDSLTTSVNSTSSESTNSTETAPTSKLSSTVSGIQAYAEQLSVPQANTFMTVLLIVSCIIAAIAVGILLFKVLLETWALFSSFPESLTGFRKHYWGTMARSIVNLILVLYGMWVLYCTYQFTHGDSWAAKLLAGITLALFTAVLGFFTFKIWSMAKKLKQAEGDVTGLYNNKETWLKYSLFYDAFKKDCWFMFLPAIIYMAAKGVVLALGEGHGLSQTVAQLAIEVIMLSLLIWNRPYERRSGNIINIFIQVVRALSVVCILVFVEELGVAQTTKTITGVVLIAIQSLLTGTLAILIVVNAMIMCCKENPHRKRRKAAELAKREDDLTPLDARNSLLDPANLNTTSYEHEKKSYALTKENSYDSFANEPGNPYNGATRLHSMSREDLVGAAAPPGREPLLPNMDGHRYRS